MRQRAFTFFALFAAIIGGAYLLSLSNSENKNQSVTSGIIESEVAPRPAHLEKQTVTAPNVERSPKYPAKKDDPRLERHTNGKVSFKHAIEIARQMHDPESDTYTDLERLNEAIGFYRMVFKQNPVAGDNQMVISALTGNNPENIIVFPPDHPSINANGELLDRWETPYFFHALSSQTDLEIFSAGPDKKFGTHDDISFTDRGSRPLRGGDTTKS
ncbi:MAG: type II secretion system protein GspG [Verrucomicrobiota bacterium]